MKDERNWRLVLTKPKAEKKVCELLKKKNIEHYCPENRTYKKWSDRFKMMTHPLFDRFIFVCITSEEEPLIQKIDGVQNFIFWHMHAAIIKNEEIDLIKTFTSQHSNINVERATVNANDDASLLFSDQPGEDADAIEPKKQICKALLPSLGFILIAEVPKYNVEIINVSQPKFAKQSIFNTSYK